jgi:CheY-like chemotaxis protein
VRALHVAAPAAVPLRANPNKFDHTLAERYPLRISPAEDNDINQKRASRGLNSFGYLADVSAIGLEVLSALEGQPYDRVLMDIQMPEMIGLEATRQILRRRPDEHQRPRLIAMSASSMREDVGVAVEAGMDD